MSFETEPTKTPESIGDIVVTLIDGFELESGDPIKSAYFQVEIILSDGTKILRRGNLVPHITAAQRQGLIDFMESLRTQAESQILG